MKVDAKLAARLEADEQAIRIAEELARRLGQPVAVFDVEGNKFWVAEPVEESDDKDREATPQASAATLRVVKTG